MTALKQAHIDAVARHLTNVEWVQLPEVSRKLRRLQAQEILDDPACIPAMLEALTRHGALAEETRDYWTQRRLVTPWEEQS